MFSVPIAVLKQIAGGSVDFSFSRTTDEYEFRYVEPEPISDEPSSGLILPASVHPDKSESLKDPVKPLRGEVNL
jgi:hypothetical protein